MIELFKLSNSLNIILNKIMKLLNLKLPANGIFLDFIKFLKRMNKIFHEFINDIFILY
jgi:hypothetical protein